MFIPEFWCGVATTLLAELAVIITAAVLSAINKKGGDGK